MFKFLCLLSLLSLNLVVSADAEERSTNCVREKLFGGSCPLKALRHLKDNPPEAIEVKTVDGVHEISSQSQSAQEEAVIRAIFGDEKTAQLTADWADVDSDVTPVLPENIDTFDAISKIVELAQDRKVVMLNEAHHVSMHRMFALDLAKALRKSGYMHIAAETFGNVSALNDRRYPTLKDGAYTGDPEFGHFIRMSASLGYDFVNYESGKFDRELGQAENLASFLENNPKAKLFVYAGYAHIREVETDSGDSWMAKHFKELTGLNPLTIDQVGGTSHYKTTINDPNYAMVAPLVDDNSKVFRVDGNWLTSMRYQGSVDMTVFHPPEKMINNRASWLVADANRKPFATSGLDLTEERPLVLKAVLKNEWEQSGKLAIPVVQVLAEEKDISPLYLPIGEYVLMVETWSGEQIVLDEYVTVE